MTALLLLLKPFLPYVVGVLAALVGGGTYVWNAKRKAKAEGIAEQQAKEAAANARDIQIIHDATGAQPIGGVQSDPNNRDNAKG